MIIQNIQRSRNEEATQTLSALVTFETPGPRTFRVYFEFRNAPGEIAETADPFVIAFLSPGMLLNEDLTVHGGVDPELLSIIDTKIMPVMRRWFPAFHSPRIEADELKPISPDDTGRISATAFSGGLDAVYNAAKFNQTVDWLMTSQGFDVRTYQQGYWNRIYPQISDVASTLSKPLMSVRTNLREISHYQAILTRNGKIDPDYYILGQNGPIGHYFAAIARCMLPFCSEFMIGSSTTYDDLFIYGSHPLLDPMWSSSHQQMLHIGCEASRSEKITWLKKHFPSALRRLRVCWRPRTQSVNCGSCEKCLRTMAELMLCDAQDHVETFAWPADFSKLRHVNPDRLRLHYWMEIRKEALRQGNNEIIHAANMVLGKKRILFQSWREWNHRKKEHLKAREMWRYTSRIMKPPTKDLYRVPNPD